MSLSIALVVLFSALLHASWNAILRINVDRLGVMTLLSGFSALIALPGILLLPLPAPEAWGWLGTSALLHIGYSLFLVNAYAHGELGKVYPLARGTAPLVALIASLAYLGEPVGTANILGIVTLGAGIIALAFDQGLRVVMSAPKGILLAFATSVFIGGYTICDGLGARRAGHPLGYTAWLFVLEGAPLFLYALVIRGKGISNLFAEQWRPGLAAGALSLSAYGIVIWAMTAAPIALVAALRETSVVFATAIGVVFLGERPTPARAVCVCVVLAGLVLMRI